MLEAGTVACREMPAAQGRFHVMHWREPARSQVTDTVIEEVPVALVYNGIAHAVMLASPGDLEDFGVGFSLSEGIVESARDIRDIVLDASPGGLEIRLEIASARLHALKARRRALAGRTGCGLCGVESLSQALAPVRPVAAGGRLDGGALDAAFGELAALQRLHRATGACHAAGFATWSGSVRQVREDVGRHNALDKLIGAMARCGIDPRSGFALVTSRASYEMVHKTAAAGIRVLAALSAPTGLAVRTAQQAGVTLIGFCGRQRSAAYAHPERLGDG
jgi:formate dehydrogenase accessory protein FdhD